MNMIESLWAVIPAAGAGVRAGSKVPKQFVEIAGKTILEWTTDRIMSMPEVSGGVLALPRGYESHGSVRWIVETLALKHNKPLVTVTGGQTRQESVGLALEKIPPHVSWVMIHDGSRPLISRDLALRVIQAAREHSAAVCGTSLSDTVKAIVPSHQGDLCFVHSTLSRDGIVTVQTPQVFKLSLLRQCHETAKRDGFTGTDDGQLVERYGYKVAVVEGERTNFKVTFPGDFALAAALLEKQASGSEPASGAEHFGEMNRPGSGSRRARRARRLLQREEAPVPVTGFGFDVHPLVHGRKYVLGGVEIPWPKGLLGHSDADVLCHAVADAVLGALSLGDIGKWFPPEDSRFRDASSLGLLADIWSTAGIISEIVHLDCTLVAQEPRLSPYIEHMRYNISQVFSISMDKISIKATSPEKLGSLGQGQGIAAFCVATLIKKGRG
jgi:2-C-methyl-D-erythritol 4-phosphate cytidylyltransferase/2-C-methyl-D-erythritol 2,4-cyclodiphosphate synthase